MQTVQNYSESSDERNVRFAHKVESMFDFTARSPLALFLGLHHLPFLITCSMETRSTNVSLYTCASFAAYCLPVNDRILNTVPSVTAYYCVHNNPSQLVNVLSLRMLMVDFLPRAHMHSKGYSDWCVCQYVSMFVDTKMSSLSKLGMLSAFSCTGLVTKVKIITYMCLTSNSLTKSCKKQAFSLSESQVQVHAQTL